MMQGGHPSLAAIAALITAIAALITAITALVHTLFTDGRPKRQ